MRFAFLAFLLLGLACPLRAQLLIDPFTANAGPFTDTLGIGAGTDTPISINGSPATRTLGVSVDQGVPGVSATSSIQNGTGWFSSGHIGVDNGYSSVLAYDDFPALDLTATPFALFQIGTITGNPTLHFAVIDAFNNDALGAWDLTSEYDGTAITFDIRDIKLSDTISIDNIVGFQVSIGSDDADSSALITRFEFVAQDPLGHPQAVPEPASWALMVIATTVLAFAVFRRAKQA